jgi:glutaredoxin
MEISYELTQDDVREIQTWLLAVRQQEARKSPRQFALFGLALGVLCWPLWNLAARNRPLLAETAPRLGVYLAVLGVALLTASLVRSRTPMVRSPWLDAFLIRRMTRQALQGTVLGPVTVSIGEQGLVRRNTRDERKAAWSEVRDILRSPRVLIVRLKDPRRVFVVPTRAFPDAPGAAAFVERLEALAGHKSVDVGSAPAAPTQPWRVRARLPLLLGLLGFSVMLLIVERGPVWYYDPRPANPPGGVIVYSTDWCPVCERLRLCLQRHRVPFEERDIEKSTRAQAEWSALDGTAIPVTVVGQRVAYGLRREQLQGALAEAGYRVDCWSQESSDEQSEP